MCFNFQELADLLIQRLDALGGEAKILFRACPKKIEAEHPGPEPRGNVQIIMFFTKFTNTFPLLASRFRPLVSFTSPKCYKTIVHTLNKILIFNKTTL